MLLFASDAEDLLFRHSSRVGRAVSKNTVINNLRRLGHDNSNLLRIWGRDPSIGLLLRIDNVQTFFESRIPGFGRENEVMMGISGLAMQSVDYIPELVTIDAMKKFVEDGRRQDLTVERLLRMINTRHIHRMAILHWAKVIATYIPELHPLLPEIHKRIRAESLQSTGVNTPLHRTQIRPLATSAKDEKQLSELKDAIRDFLDQIGQTKDSYQRRKVFVGGDGLTFELMLRLKDYLQFQDDEFDRLDLIEPFLEQWHTAWTDLSRIFETFWGDQLLKNPASLGHSASKIGVKTPSNLSKVDYYSGRHTAYLVLDARMMDCVR